MKKKIVSIVALLFLLTLCFAVTLTAGAEEVSEGSSEGATVSEDAGDRDSAPREESSSSQEDSEPAEQEDSEPAEREDSEPSAQEDSESAEQSEPSAQEDSQDSAQEEETPAQEEEPAPAQEEEQTPAQQEEETPAQEEETPAQQEKQTPAQEEEETPAPVDEDEDEISLAYDAVVLMDEAARSALVKYSGVIMDVFKYYFPLFTFDNGTSTYLPSTIYDLFGDTLEKDIEGRVAFEISLSDIPEGWIMTSAGLYAPEK